jgi:hypothetical protein
MCVSVLAVRGCLRVSRRRYISLHRNWKVEIRWNEKEEPLTIFDRALDGEFVDIHITRLAQATIPVSDNPTDHTTALMLGHPEKRPTGVHGQMPDLQA